MNDEPIKKVLSNGTIEYRLNGKRHREDGPARIHPWDAKEWYRNGELHREDGPAIEYADGTKKWFHKGRAHREDGPAIEFSDGTKEWYLNDKLHREDGPAVDFTNGNKYWYLNGEKISEQAWIEELWSSLTEEQREELIFNGFQWTDKVAGFANE